MIVPLIVAWLMSGIRFVPVGAPGLEPAAFGFRFRGRPLTGIVYDGWFPLRLSRLTLVVDGKRQGPEILWHPNGRRWIERRYQQGLENGIQRAWFPDGSPQFLKNFASDGQADGDFYTWHENGRLAQYVRYDHGREVAAKSWTGGGKPFYNYVWRDGERVGLRGDTFCEPRKKN